LETLDIGNDLSTLISSNSDSSVAAQYFSSRRLHLGIVVVKREEGADYYLKALRPSTINPREEEQVSLRL
jgi:hypothetical protein